MIGPKTGIDYSKYRLSTSTPAATSSRTGIDYSKYKLPPPAPVEEKDGFFKGLAKAIIRPVATLAARPVQLGQSLELSARKALFPQNVRPGETQETVQNILPRALPGIVAPAPQGGRDVIKDVGRAVETAALGVGGGAAVQAGKTGLKGAALQAAKVGAVQGAKAGALGGAGLSLEEGNLNPLKVGADAAVGAGTGAALGGILGGGIGLVGKGARSGAEAVGRRTGNPSVIAKDALEVSRPALSKAERIAAISQGRAEKTGLPFFKEVKITQPSKRDLEVAKAVEGVVRKQKDEIQNISAINNEVTKIDKAIAQHLDSNNAIFNQNQLRSRLMQAKEKSKVIFAGDQTLENRYNAIIDEMLDNIDKNNLSGLFKARKQFDGTVRAKFPRTFDGNPSDNVTRNAILDVRREVNDFIASLLPEGNQFRAQLKKEHLMLEAAENIAEKAEMLVKSPRGRTRMQAILSGIGLGALGAIGYSVVAAPVSSGGR